MIGLDENRGNNTSGMEVCFLKFGCKGTDYF